jgi:N-acetylglutamate synthase-like GNAT family acetyltransferase
MKDSPLFVMQIGKATKEDEKRALEIATTLKGWFTKEGLKNMIIDFQMNHLVVAKEKDAVLGFLCYSSYCGKMLLIWMGVTQSTQRKGIGQKLLEWAEKEAERLELRSLEVETLPEEVDYAPYQQTRSFFYKNGFERILYKKARIKGWDDQIVLEKRI